MAKQEIRVPDLGDFADVEIIDVLVAPGTSVVIEDPLITLETDKAAMDIPAPAAGTIVEMNVKLGDKLNQGDLIGTLEVAGESADKSVKETAVEPVAEEPVTAKADPVAATGYQGTVDAETELVVIGSGPGGYTAAFRAADLGLNVTLIERFPSLGGVCLNVGCIPSKALLHAARVIDEAAEMSERGIKFGKPKIDKDKLRGWKDDIVGKLTGGIAGMAKSRKVNVVQGVANFVSANHLEVKNGKKSQVIAFRQCIIAAGSESFMLPDLPDDPRIMDSTGALQLEELPERMLVIGGGIIGLEMACVYDALGVNVTVVELLDVLMMGADRDMVRPLEKRVRSRYENILLGTKVTKMEPHKQGIKVTFEGKQAPSKPEIFGRVLVAVGRKPNGNEITAEKAGVHVDERGFIAVDKQQRTNVSHVFAIGDIVGQPMLAHKATHEGKVAAEVAAGHKRFFDARVIPSVAYTDPEVAWVGVTEEQAKAEGIDIGIGKFPWAASGRALSVGRTEGATKLIFDKKTGQVIGGAMVGPNAGELVAEVALAIEMGANAEDIGLTIHPHPTLSETVNFSAEVFEGTVTDLYLAKRK